MGWLQVAEMDRPLCKCHDEPMHKQGFSPDGRQKWTCSRKSHLRTQKWLSANRESHKEMVRRWAERNPDRQRAADRRWRANNPEKVREINARRLYVGGLYLGTAAFTKAEREEMLNGAVN